MGSGSCSSLEPPGRRKTKIRSKQSIIIAHDARWTLKMRAIKPIERLVPVSCMHYCTSTPGLSTWWSTTVLKGILVLRWVSRLDAFSGYPVLGTNPLKIPTPTADRDRTVSRRSEPSSRTTLIGEQPNPWDLLQPQDVMSRHRGAKRCRRYGLLGIISLLSPAYLLSVERWPFHAGPPDHYVRLSSLLDLSVSQSGRLMPLHSTSDFRPL